MSKRRNKRKNHKKRTTKRQVSQTSSKPKKHTKKSDAVKTKGLTSNKVPLVKPHERNIKEDLLQATGDSVESFNLYDSFAKIRAREELRKTISAKLLNGTNGISPKDVKVVALLGEKGYELIQVYDALGIPRQNITCIEKEDKEASVIESKFPQVKLAHCTAFEFFQNTKAKFHVVSLDYMGHISSHAQDLRLVRNCLQDQAVIYANLSANREQHVCKGFYIYNAMKDIQGLDISSEIPLPLLRGNLSQIVKYNLFDCGGSPIKNIVVDSYALNTKKYKQILNQRELIEDNLEAGKITEEEAENRRIFLDHFEKDSGAYNGAYEEAMQSLRNKIAFEVLPEYFEKHQDEGYLTWPGSRKGKVAARTVALFLCHALMFHWDEPYIIKAHKANKYIGPSGRNPMYGDIFFVEKNKDFDFLDELINPKVNSVIGRITSMLNMKEPAEIANIVRKCADSVIRFHKKGISNLQQRVSLGKESEINPFFKEEVSEDIIDLATQIEEIEIEYSSKTEQKPKLVKSNINSFKDQINKTGSIHKFRPGEERAVARCLLMYTDLSNKKISEITNLSRGVVGALAAHRTMGTYNDLDQDEYHKDTLRLKKDAPELKNIDVDTILKKS